jgi:DNA-binding transcriptional LysR family regulator
MMPLQTRQVEAFRAVMLTGSMTAAAEMLCITQPAVSRLIRDFETELGLMLFDRRGPQIVATADAITLFDEVERSFVGLARIAELAKAIKGNLAGSLRIAAMPVLMGSALPRFVASFLKPRPNIRISLIGHNSLQVVEAVMAGQVELGFADAPLEAPALDVTLFSTSAVVVLPAGHRLAQARRICAADLEGERMVSPSDGTLFRFRVDAALADVRYDIAAEASLSLTICQLVAGGLGVSIVSPYAAEEFRDRGLAIVPFVPFLETGFVALRSRQRPLAALGSTFLDEFAATAQRWQYNISA